MKQKRHKISRRSQYVAVSLQGIINMEDIAAALKESMTAAYPNISMPMIWDLTAADISHMDSEKTIQTAEKVDSIKRDLPVDYIGLVSNKAINLSMLAFFRDVYERDIIKVFENYQEAEEWILNANKDRTFKNER